MINGISASLFALVKDSLNNQNRRVEISRQEMQFDFDKKEALTEIELNRQSTIKKAILKYPILACDGC